MYEIESSPLLAFLKNLAALQAGAVAWVAEHEDEIRAGIEALRRFESSFGGEPTISRHS